jgi:hypothetical protein
MNAQVAGKQSSPAPTVNLNRSKTFGKTRVNFKSFDTPIKAGKEVMLMFDLLDASTNQTIYDLQPYLGEKGHLVILRQSPSLTRADYIHAHATNEVPWCRGTASCPAPAPGIVFFKTQFPQPGKYKLWGQFNRQGKIVTADFWVNVI